MSRRRLRERPNCHAPIEPPELYPILTVETAERRRVPIIRFAKDLPPHIVADDQPRFQIPRECLEPIGTDVTQARRAEMETDAHQDIRFASGASFGVPVVD